MNPVLERSCYDSRRHEMRLLAVAALVLLVASALWHGVRRTVVYRVACSSIGCLSRGALISSALRQRYPLLPDDDPQAWSLNWAKPEWIAWSFLQEHVPLGDGAKPPMEQVIVTDHTLTVRGAFAGDVLGAPPPADSDGDGLCEVVLGFGSLLQEQDVVWWVVLRLGDEHNEIVWIAMMDESIWHSRKIRLKPIWRDEDGDGQDEFVFITVERTRSPAGDIVFKPPQTIAVFEWTAPGGILRTRLLPDDCGILPWSSQGAVPMRVDQTTDFDPLVRGMLPVPEQPSP